MRRGTSPEESSVLPAGSVFDLFMDAGEVLDHLSGNDHTCYRGYEGHAARNVAPFRAFVLCYGRADTVCAAAVDHIVQRTDRQLF